jgi:nucleoside-diphosphate kinase
MTMTLDAVSEALASRLCERTLVICKPECVECGDHPEVLERIVDMKYMMPCVKMFQWSRDAIIEFYGPSIKKYQDKVDLAGKYSTYHGKPSLLVIVQGDGCVNAMRKITGSTFPNEAMVGTIRGNLAHADSKTFAGLTIPVANVVHSSEDEKEFDRERGVLYRHQILLPGDMHPYIPATWHAIYGKYMTPELQQRIAGTPAPSA